MENKCILIPLLSGMVEILRKGLLIVMRPDTKRRLYDVQMWPPGLFQAAFA